MQHFASVNDVMWQGQFGHQNNRSEATVESARKGFPLWNVALSSGALRHLVVGDNNRCIIVQRGDRYCLLVIESGEIVWKLESADKIAYPTPLPNGRLLLLEGSVLHIKQQATGEDIERIELTPWANLFVTPNGQIVHDRVNSDKSRELVVRSMDGEIHWWRTIKQPLLYPPLLDSGLIIFGDGSQIKAFDAHKGDLQWIIQMDFGKVVFTTPMVRYQDSTILFGAKWYEGFGFLLLDSDKQTLTPLQPPNHPPLNGRLPIAMSAYGDGRLLIQGTDHDLICLSNTGILWSQKAHKAPNRIVTDAGGHVIAAYSPPLDIWQKYNRFYDKPHCFLKGFDIADGNETFEWIAPEPIENQLGVGKGAIFLKSGQQLWAIS